MDTKYQNWCDRKRRKKIKPKLLSKRLATPEEVERYDKLFEKELQKMERDASCGGVNFDGSYVRLHDR